jgi:hypothetical protein
MPGLTFSNELISRDEGLHTDFAVLLYRCVGGCACFVCAPACVLRVCQARPACAAHAAGVGRSVSNLVCTPALLV